MDSCSLSETNGDDWTANAQRQVPVVSMPQRLSAMPFASMSTNCDEMCTQSYRDCLNAIHTHAFLLPSQHRTTANGCHQNERRSLSIHMGSLGDMQRNNEIPKMKPSPTDQDGSIEPSCVAVGRIFMKIWVLGEF